MRRAVLLGRCRVIGKVLGILGIVVSLFVVLFLGGLFSAWWEIREERKAGKPVTRPAWDRRELREAQGGYVAALRIWWATKGNVLTTCGVCGLGPVVWYEGLDAFNPAGYGCSAWEAGSPGALRIHAAAGGYRRTSHLRAAA